MPALLRSRLLRLAPTGSGAAALALLAGAALAAPLAQAHGGTTLVKGVQNGVTVLVQSTPSTTPNGGPAADVSTIVDGSGTGNATVDYWIRPAGRKAAFKINAERDAGGTYHADISTSERGDVAEWAISAVVTLEGGSRLRVTNAPSNPPGPPSRPAGASAAPDEAPTTPTLTEGNPNAKPITTTPTPSTPADAPIKDISGENDGPPGWVFPSLLVLSIVGLAYRAVTRRRVFDDQADAGSE